jgi:hypothetical protein
MAALRFRSRRTRRLWLFGVTGALVCTGVLLLVASAGAILSGGSTFESGDGNLVVDNAGKADWNSPLETINCSSSVNCGLDLVNSQADNALGQGAKEDDPAPSVVTGSIPPSKDDLSRFYVNKQRINGNDYLYLAWERSNLLGSAHMDFEFNQSSTASANGVTPVRTVGDMLIDFDFGGSGVPVLALHRWVNSGNPATVCESSNTLPCWNKAISLGGFSEGAVNSADVVDTNGPNAPRTLAGNTKNGVNSTFGEAGINLTGAGVFSQGTCQHFGAAYLKSRSSGNSFTSELKDFIAPIPVNISNCGTVKIHKQDDLGTALQGAVFTLFTDNAPKDGAAPHGAEDVATSFTCTTDASGNCEMGNVPFGDYWAVETTGIANHDLAPDQSFSLTSSTPNLTIGPLTFVDPRKPGAILVTKTAKNATLGAGDHPLAGVSFTVNGVTKQTDSNGQACFDGLTLGTAYTVHETAPTGYSGSADQSITPTVSATCTTGTPKAANFSDKPLTDLSITVTSEVAGATKSTISCDKGAGNSGAAADPATLSKTGLEPDTYTCTIVIDP